MVKKKKSSKASHKKSSLKENTPKGTSLKETSFLIKGTTCPSCEKIVKKQAMKVNGVEKVEFDYTTEIGSVTYDPSLTDIDEILYSIEEKGYEGFIYTPAPESASNKSRFVFPKIQNWLFVVLGIIVLFYFGSHYIESFDLPEISAGMGYGLLFIVGLLTGFHCIGMCGGFVLSYTAKDAEMGKSSHFSHLKYGAAKTLSYTFFGAVFGLLGSIIAFTPQLRGVIGVLAGIFLIIYGLRMLNIFPVLRKFRIALPESLEKKIFGNTDRSNPLIIGFLNGLMIACGPLQAIYIMAAGTGSMIEGAKLLFVFGLGTLPAMLGFGYFASYISNKMTHKIVKASAIIVMVLGLIMLNNGLALTGTGFDVKSIGASLSILGGSSNDEGLVMDGEYQVIEMTVDGRGWTPDRFVLKKDVPVKWVIHGEEINGCNNAIQVPEYNLEFSIKKGEQVIEFTPTREGVVSWSCWMGMIPGTFIVKDSIDGSVDDIIEEENIPPATVGSCGGSSGGCGCGGGL